MDNPFAKYFEEYQKFLAILTSDISIAEEELRQSDTQGKRRIYVRAVFALFEGDIFQRKRLVLIRHEQVQETVSEEELALLREEQYDLDEKGNVRVQPRFLRLPDNLHFSFRMLARALAVDYELDLGEGWLAFKKAIKIRNRIMHPKQVSDLEITDEDLGHVQTATAWYKEVTRKSLAKFCQT